jgi:large subunit ribosomal protein L15
MRLHSLNPGSGARKRRKRLGCGESSGKGKTCGKGHKGQKSRSGASIRPGFEGGQMPLIRQLPKRGFNNARFKTEYAIVNVGVLEERFEDGDVINETALRDRGLVKGRWAGVKILGVGELKKKLSVEADKVSDSAREKIEKAGGSIAEPAVTPDATKEPVADKKPVPAKKKAAPAKKKAPAAKKKAPAAKKEEPVASVEEEPAIEEEKPAADEAEDTKE